MSFTDLTILVYRTTAWNYIHPNEYISEQCDDKVHFRIKGFTSNWRSAQRLNIFDLLHENELDDDDDSRIVAGEEMKLDSETLGSKYFNPMSKNCF